MLRLTTETQRTQRRHREDRMNPHLNQLSHEIIGAAIEVHRTLGPGLLESLYHGCLCRELLVRGRSVRARETFTTRVQRYSTRVWVSYRHTGGSACRYDTHTLVEYL